MPSEQDIATARAALLDAGLTTEQCEHETGFGLRRLPNCPAVAPVQVKVAAGALSITGAVKLAGEGRFA